MERGQRQDRDYHERQRTMTIEEKLAAPTGKDAKAKAKDTRNNRWLAGREHVYINRIIREFKYTNSEKKRLLDKVI